MKLSLLLRTGFRETGNRGAVKTPGNAEICPGGGRISAGGFRGHLWGAVAPGGVIPFAEERRIFGGWGLVVIVKGP